MNFTQKELTLAEVQGLTARQQQTRKVVLRHAQQLLDDSGRAERRAAQQCVMCYYHASRLAGQAFTTTNCRACNKELQFSSTYVDALCLECARTLRLCRHCGSDLELHVRRRVNVALIPKVTPFSVESPYCGADEGSGPCQIRKGHVGPHDPTPGAQARPVLLPLKMS